MKLRKAYGNDQWLLIDDTTLEIQQINKQQVFTRILKGKTYNRWFISKEGEVYDIWTSLYITDRYLPSIIKNILGFFNMDILHYCFVTDNILTLVENFNARP